MNPPLTAGKRVGRGSHTEKKGSPRKIVRALRNIPTAGIIKPVKGRLRRAKGRDKLFIKEKNSIFYGKEESAETSRVSRG